MPSMIYNEKNQYAIVEDESVAAYLSAGWKTTHESIYTEPTKFMGDLTPPTMPKKGKKEE